MVVVKTDHAQLAFGRSILKIADPEIDISSDCLIADQAAAADFWVPNHCLADAANYYVAAAADFAVMASLVRESS